MFEPALRVAIPAKRAYHIVPLTEEPTHVTHSTLSDRILRILGKRGYTPQKAEELARLLRLSEAEVGDFHAACKALARAGRIVMGARGALMLPDPPGRMVGTYRANAKGFGFVVPETPGAHADLFIPPGRSGGALTGDVVRVRMRKGGRGNRQGLLEGEVIEIIRRGHSRFTGALQHETGAWYVVPDGHVLNGPILLPDATARQARRGDHVVVELVEYPSEGRAARGVIVEVLGPSGRPDVDLRSIIAQHDLPGEFPPEVLADARRAVDAYDESALMAHREVLRDMTIITIDPPDARDFDDAISLRPLSGGHVELGVHIADVAHFVPEGSPMDLEARRRGNSVYFPRFVIPMLPEILSNGVCSLQEKQWRLTKSVFITYDGDGEVVRSRFANTMIRSTRRLTYVQAQSIIDGRIGRTSPEVVNLLKGMDRLAKLIRRRRLRDGMIVLDLPEVELVHDDEGRLTDVQPADTSFTHTIIEMFMVEANEAVCRLLTDLRWPHLRRVHDEPSFSAVESLSRFIRALGLALPRHPQRADFQRLLDQTRETPLAFPVHFAVLRSMQQAQYLPQLLGHFALASDHYTHFTSPIRRYADLTVHRLLNHYLAAGEPASGPRRGGRSRAVRSPVVARSASRSSVSPPDDIPSFEDLVVMGHELSTLERRAEAAERELRLVRILRLLADRVGDSLPGTVIGVSQFGLYLQVDRYLIDGVLRLERIRDDWWDIDIRGGAIYGSRSGIRIGIGDRLDTVIASVDVPKRTLELALPGGTGTGKKSRVQSVTKAADTLKSPSEGQPPASRGRGIPRNSSASPVFRSGRRKRGGHKGQRPGSFRSRRS